MVDPALLQAYRARLPKRSSDAELIDDDAYAEDADSETESAPSGLIDRLYQEQLNGQPMRGKGLPQAVPTTKNRFT